MKTFFAVIVMSALNFLFSDKSSQENELKTAIKEADFVGFVVKPATSNLQEQPKLIVVEVFKGDAEAFYQMQNEIKLDDWEYLLIAKTYKGEITETLYPITLAQRLSPAEIRTLYEIPCYDDAVRMQYQTGTCHRDYFPICGCDDQTYGNICELRKKGLVKYRRGACK